MPVPKILILTGDAAESLEVMYPYQRLKEEGYEVHIAAPARRNCILLFMISSQDMTHTRKNRATVGMRISPLRT